MTKKMQIDPPSDEFTEHLARMAEKAKAERVEADEPEPA